MIYLVIVSYAAGPRPQQPKWIGRCGVNVQQEQQPTDQHHTRIASVQLRLMFLLLLLLLLLLLHLVGVL